MRVVLAAAFVLGAPSVPAQASAPLYVTNWGSDNVSIFRPRADGTLPLPALIAITPDGQRLYVANFNHTGPGTLPSFTVNGDGSLAPLGATVPTCGSGASGLALDHSGRTLACRARIIGSSPTRSHHARRLDDESDCAEGDGWTLEVGAILRVARPQTESRRGQAVLGQDPSGEDQVASAGGHAGPHDLSDESAAQLPGASFRWFPCVL